MQKKLLILCYMTTLFGMDYNDNQINTTEPWHDNFLPNLNFDITLFDNLNEPLTETNLLPITNPNTTSNTINQLPITELNDNSEDKLYYEILGHLKSHRDFFSATLQNPTTGVTERFTSYSHATRKKEKNNNYIIANNLICECTKRYSTIDALAKHIKTSGHTTCTYCKEQMTTRYQPKKLSKKRIVLNHLQSHLTLSNDFKCSCGKNKFESIYTLRKHIIDGKNSHYQCAYCSTMILESTKDPIASNESINPAINSIAFNPLSQHIEPIQTTNTTTNTSISNESQENIRRHICKHISELNDISNNYALLSNLNKRNKDEYHWKCGDCKSTFNKSLDARRRLDNLIRHKIDTQHFTCNDCGLLLTETND